MKNTKKVLGAMDCGCLILELEQIADLSPKYYKIEYCNKHKAAPDMYEALGIIGDNIDTVIMNNNFPEDVLFPLQAIISIACQAMNKADGK